MTPQEIRRFVECLEGFAAEQGAGYELLPSYSGRGMMGKSCVAISVDGQQDIARLFYWVADQDRDLASAHRFAVNDLWDFRTDTLGQGMVIYWPYIEAPADVPGEGDLSDDAAVDDVAQLSAERWDALMKCSRIRFIGYARGGPKGDEGPIRHIGFEFTSDGKPYTPEEHTQGQAMLVEFVDGLRGV